MQGGPACSFDSKSLPLDRRYLRSLNHVGPVARREAMELVLAVRAPLVPKNRVRLFHGFDRAGPNIRFFSENITGANLLENADIRHDLDHLATDTCQHDSDFFRVHAIDEGLKDLHADGIGITSSL